MPLYLSHLDITPALLDEAISAEAAANLMQAMHRAGSISIYEFLTPAEVLHAIARTGTMDMSVNLQRAFNSGKRVIIPNGVYPHATALEIPATAEFTLIGGGFNAELKALAAMSLQVFKKTLAEGATRAPVNIEGIQINCNRLANIGLALGAGKAGRQQRIKISNFLVGGFRGGNTNGNTTASFYENSITDIIIDAGNTYISNPSTMADWGLWLLPGATDNIVVNVVPSYMKTHGIRNQGAGCTFIACHPYGDNDTDTGPQIGIESDIFSRIVDFYADNMTVAGIRISGERVSVMGGQYYWASDNIPAAGGGCPIEVSDGVQQVSVIGGFVGNGPNNDYIRFLGAVSPYIHFEGMMPPRVSSTMRGANILAQSLAIRAGSGVGAFLDIEAGAAGQKSLVRHAVNGKTRYEAGTEGNQTAGTDAMDSYLLRALRDDGVTWDNVLRYYRGAKQLELYNKVLLPNTTRQVLQATNSPTANGEMTVSLVNDTTLRFQVRGNDGTTRSATLTLA